MGTTTTTTVAMPPIENPLTPPRERVWLATLAAVILFGALFCIGNDARLWDRDEPRYAEASRGMLETGDWVVPFHNGKWRLQKPAGIYWLQATSYAVFGESEFAARFPSAVFLALTCGLLVLAGHRLTGRLRTGLIAAGAFGLCLMTLYQAHAATTDGTLIFFSSLTVGSWFIAWRTYQTESTDAERRRRRLLWVLFYVFGAVGVLIKGPVTVAVWAVAAGTYGVWHFSEFWAAAKKIRPIGEWLPHALGIALGLAITVPWLAAIIDRTDWAFWHTFVGTDVLDRAASGQEGHSGPIIYYIPVLLLFFYPWLLLLLAFRRSLASAASRPAVRGLISLAVAPFVLFSLMGTKLPHYIYPTFPAFALLTALALDRSWRDDASVPLRRWEKWTWVGLASIGLWIGIALPIALSALGLSQLVIPSIAASIGLGITALAAMRGIAKVDARVAVIGVTIGMAVTFLGARWCAVAFNPYKPGPQLAAVMSEADPHEYARDGDGRPALITWKYGDASLAYYTGRTVLPIGGEDLASLPEAVAIEHAAGEDAWILLSINSEPDGPKEAAEQAAYAGFTPEAIAVLAEAGAPVAVVGPIFDYNRTGYRWRLLYLYRVPAADPTAAPQTIPASE